MRLAVRMLIVSLLAAATSLSATVFQPTTDRELVDRSQAVVVATVQDASSRLRSDGYVVTDYHFSIEETLKGSVADVITVSEIGGAANGRFTFIADSAAYTPGERVLAFLKAREDGTWFTTSMAMGKFSYGRNVRGETIVTRDVSALRSDPVRLAGQFERFVRDSALGLDATFAISYTTTFRPITDAFHPIALGFPASAYCFNQVRWENGEAGFTVLFYVTGSLPGVNSSTALGDIANGLSAWTGDPNAGIILNGGTSAPPNHSTSPDPNDNDNVIYLGYDGAVNVACDGTVGCTIVAGGGTHTYKSETFNSLSDTDIVIRSTVSSSQFESLITHELGHAIGFRHSDQGTPSDSSAIMNSSINAAFGSNLQSWDRDANDTVYGNGPACTNPSITGQPPANTTITSGQQATLTVTATGTTPTYQWYVGNPPNTSVKAQNGTGFQLTVAPTATTTYWVQVGGCNTSVNSNAATVTVNQPACVPPSAPAPVASPSSIPTGQSSTLSVSPTGTSPFTYQWFIGNSGVTTTSINGATSSFVTVSPTVTTNYWVRVTGQCAPPSDSPATTVTVTCAPISGSPSATPNPINPGQSTTLSVATTGTGPFTYQWFNGNLGDNTSPINGATGPSTIVSPSTSAFFWVHVTAPCGSQDAAVLVNVNGVCNPVAITTHPPSPTIPAGSSTTLTVIVSGTAPFSYQWYTGTSGNTTNMIAGATGPSVTVTPATTITTYWVHVSNSCNTVGVNSTTAVVTLSANCTSPAITTQPLGVLAGIGTTATLKVVATGTTLHYQWYKGVKGDISTKVGTDSGTFTTGVSVTTSYWVRVSAHCGSPTDPITDSDTAVVTAVMLRRQAVRH